MGFTAAESCLNHFRNVIGPAVDASQGDLDKGYRLMVAAMREKDPTKSWYPNANSTMRLTYGPVSYTHLRAHETVLDLVCRLLLEKKKQTNIRLSTQYGT